MHAHYGRILLRFWKNSLIREMTFRGHFMVNVASELFWVVLLLVFIKIIFSKTPDVRGWNEHQYLFLMGTHMLVTGVFEAMFFGNLWRVSQLVRTGDLDFVLLRPANPQFLLSFERMNYSALANIPVAGAICAERMAGAVKSSTTCPTRCSARRLPALSEPLTTTSHGPSASPALACVVA